jgi:hypothetical protein
MSHESNDKQITYRLLAEVQQRSICRKRYRQGRSPAERSEMRHKAYSTH